jgi:uncharacterized repeat protein (TIGR03803 family)
MSAITLMRGKQSGTKLCFLSQTVRDRRNAWGVRAAYAVVLLCLATAIASPGQTFTTLVNFNKSDGALPESSLIQGFDGKLYGTTNWGPNDNGNVFKVTDSGTLTTLHNFCTPDKLWRWQSSLHCGGPGAEWDVLRDHVRAWGPQRRYGL